MHFIKMNRDICVFALVLAVISVQRWKFKNVKKKHKISGVQYIKYKKRFLIFFVPTCVSALIFIKYGEMSQFEEGHFLRLPDFSECGS